ncbi:transposase [Candidatus Symbiopectobacterium sp. NZEC135]|uniref:transposase n=1 Tax=Candidatus Symbiopectobacterium sp. NZEC135 TaxID=2820471 RepID=UPI00222688A1|nr:transposase [Candidatus Symbiopectobacterium sp. NZEC135]MCW2483724.1 transposase [Candidatus Symbiopectobacterium sp. NZEC135]
MSTQQRRSRKQYSPELKLKLVKMAMKAIDEGNSVAALARQYDVNDNLLFKWVRLWQREGQVSRPRRKYRKTSSPALLPVQLTTTMSDLPSVVTSAGSRDIVCHARLRQGDITLHNPSAELMRLVLREMMSGELR